MCNLNDVYVVYITYHVDVGETPFLIAVDYGRKAIVLSIRGTLSLQVKIS
jgi:sn1-specific diacylglycerol lipase